MPGLQVYYLTLLRAHSATDDPSPCLQGNYYVAACSDHPRPTMKDMLANGRVLSVSPDHVVAWRPEAHQFTMSR